MQTTLLLICRSNNFHNNFKETKGYLIRFFYVTHITVSVICTVTQIAVHSRANLNICNSLIGSLMFHGHLILDAPCITL